MLQVTDAAASVLKSEVLRGGEPMPQRVSATAVRIRPAVPDDGRQALTIEPVMGPEPGDVPTEASDLDVFVAPELADRLDSAVLDVEPTAEGPQIVLREHPEQG